MVLRKIVVATAAVWGLVVASAAPAGAIVGGAAATPQDAPYLVSVRMDGWTGKSAICGGFLLTAHKVVTAASCVDGATASKLEVRWGGLNRSGLPKGSWVSKISVYHNWDASRLTGDVAVLTLTTEASETDGVTFAKLATLEPPAGEMATVTGWGRTSPDSPLPESAQTVQLPILDTATCQKDYPGSSDGDPAFDPNGMICAGPQEGGQGICKGDSGDPLSAYTRTSPASYG
ncbi:serine protease [Streptomyces vinaceus]|uniref:serine protease n=1 Tax=Streptomyces vinaceus TaxID=1960 RepID=UPI0038306206